MSVPGDPSTSTQTEPGTPAPQAADAAVPDRIPLPPPAVAPPEAPPRPRKSRLDWILAAVVVAFAFLVASTPARNSDLWLHLATGRALVQGQYHFGADPFAQGTANVYWVNTNWLYDLVTYAVFQGLGGLDGLGGAGVVVAKAVLVTLLALVLLRLGACGRGLWAPAVGAAWALLVVSPWLTLHPMVVSYLFLALTLYFLERPHRAGRDDGAAAEKPASFTDYWPLPPLFALWVNLDAWFLLGPLTVAFYLVGQALQSKFGPGRDSPAVRRGETTALGLLLPACLAACLLSPHHFHAFLTPPPLGLSPAARVLEKDPAFHNLVLSPFQSAYYENRGLGWTAAGLAFYPLALVGALSFGLNLAGWRWRRGLVWLALFLLAALQVRAVPFFFAVAAGPMFALNVQEFLGRRHAGRLPGGEALRWAAAGRVVSLLAGLVLFAAAWAAWGEALFAGAVGMASCANGTVVAPYEMTPRLQVLTARPGGGPDHKPTAVERLAYHLREDYLARQDHGPRSLLYLALRAARRAVRDNPDDAQAYFVLGETYRRLTQNTREQPWNPPERLWETRPARFPLLYRVRTAEAAAAYARALAVNPNLEQAHMGLISLYQDLNYQDEVLDQLREVLRCNEAAGRRPGETAQQFHDRLLDLRDLVDKKAKDVGDRLDKYEVKSAGLSVFARAQTAWLEFGLAGKALSLLLDSDVSVFGKEGMAMELELLLHTGRTREVREWPDAERAKDLLGSQPYLELQVQLAAASGDYRQADENLKSLAAEAGAFEVERGVAVPARPIAEDALRTLTGADAGR